MASPASLAPGQTDDAPQVEKSTFSPFKRFVVVLLLGTATLLLLDTLTMTQFIRKGFHNFLIWFQQNPEAGMFAFAALFIPATVLFVPVSLLALCCGYVSANVYSYRQGAVFATATVFAGAVFGGIAAFLLGRYLWRSWMAKVMTKHRSLQAMEKALAQKGFVIMLLLRLSPLVPFNAMNYLFGMTCKSFSSFARALIAILPGVVFYVSLGATAGSFANGTVEAFTKGIQITMLVFALFFGCFGVGLMIYHTRKELAKMPSTGETQNTPEGENVALIT